MDINDIKWADEESALKVATSSNQQARGWDTSDGTISGIVEKPNLQQTNGWMHTVYKWIEYLNALRYPVGTVISSLLTEEQFYEQASNDWTLCDGRSVPASAYTTLTGLTNVPDLRARYIAGAGTNSGTINGESVPEIGLLGEVVTSNPSFASLSGSASVGGEKWETGNLEVDMDSIVFEGDTAEANFKAEFLGSSNSQAVMNGDFVEEYNIYDVNGTPEVTFNVSNYFHDHNNVPARITGSITSNTSTLTTPVSDKFLLPKDDNSKDYDVALDSIACNYFIRIN